MNENFLDYLQTLNINPFDLAFEDLDKIKTDWKNKFQTDIIYSKLSNLNIKIDNNKLIEIVKRMTKDDTNQTNNVGSWLYYSLIKNYDKSQKYKEKVSNQYQKLMEKYIDSFIKMLTK